MADVLISRYDQFVENNSITHLASNLSATEIGLLYPLRQPAALQNAKYVQPH
jgi:hypothetical protein